MATRVIAAAVLVAAAVLSAACPEPGGNRDKANQPDTTVDVVVTGTVFDQTKNPLAGATITVAARTRASTVSDAAGHFTAPAVAVRFGDAVFGAALKAEYSTNSRYALPDGNALQMRAAQGSLSSQDVGGHQVITLPPNTNALLFVGQQGSQLTQPVSITLTTHRVGG